MTDIIKIVESLEDSGVLIDGATVTVIMNLDLMGYFLKKKLTQSKDGAYIINLADEDSNTMGFIIY